MTVLALEFRGVREAADFGFLAGVRRVDPIGGHVAAALTIRQQAEQLADQRLDLVLAYCSCAALGAHVAELSAAGLVLIDPDVVTHAAVKQDFTHLCSLLGAVPDGDWDSAFASVRDDLAEAHGGDDQAYEMVDDLFDRYRAWLRFLDASASAQTATPPGEITVIAGKPLPELGKLVGDSTRVRITRVAADAGTLASPLVREQLAVEVGRAESRAVMR
jgi:hypothetical protein